MVELITQYTEAELQALPSELREWLAYTPEGCLVWLGQTHDGYGPHLRVWDLIRGPESREGVHLGHTCHDVQAQAGTCTGGEGDRHRRCVLHVEPQAPGENLRRLATVTAPVWVRCGHPRTPDNTSDAPRFARCRACRDVRGYEARPKLQDARTEWAFDRQYGTLLGKLDRKAGDRRAAATKRLRDRDRDRAAA